MRFDDWMLAFHLLSAFSLVAGLVLFWILIVVGRRQDTPEATLSLGPVAKVGTATVGVGMVGTIVFGLWLAFSIGNYDIWDAWIIIALVLWFVGSALGVDISAPAIERARELAQSEGLGNVTFEHADAQAHRFPHERFDLAMSRFGTMFFEDPGAAFA